MIKSAHFYMANLGADVVRCINAADEQDLTRYTASLDRAKHTLSFVADTSPHAYQEGQSMLTALDLAHSPVERNALREQITLFSQSLLPMIMRG